MRLAHFEAFAPICPICARAGRAPATLVLAVATARTATTVEDGALHCPACDQEYPIVCGIPIIVPELRRLLAERGVELMVRDDLDPAQESLLGDAIGPDTWFDAMRQMASTYGWDAYADLDPAEPPPAHPAAPTPGAARRCLARLLQLAGPGPGPTRILDAGCAAGRTSFDLAEAHTGALVLGLDMNLGLLRLAQGALGGHACYPRRRIGLVYDRRRIPTPLAGAERVDFWACDASALPFPPGAAQLCAALNLLDCVPDPRRLLESLLAALPHGGRLLLATPYDWSTRATPPEAWLGGHSQRAAHAGAGEAFLHALLGHGTTHAIPGIAITGEHAHWPWQTRLHDRSAVQYSTHLLALRRDR